MRVINRSFSSIAKSTILIGRSGENGVTKLEIDISREIEEFEQPVFELMLKTPAYDEPYPVCITVSENTVSYVFTGTDLQTSGYGQLEVLVCSPTGEVLKSATAKTRIERSISDFHYPGPLQKLIDAFNDVKERVDALANDVPSAVDVGHWNYAYSSSHTHENKTALDGVTAAKITAWDGAAADSHTHENKAVLDDVNSTDVGHWNSAYYASHSHENKTVIDKFNEASNRLKYGTETVLFEKVNGFTPLKLGQSYTNLIFRSNIGDVPITITSNSISSDDIEHGDEVIGLHVAVLDANDYGVHFQTLIEDGQSPSFRFFVDGEITNSSDSIFYWTIGSTNIDNSSRITNWKPTKIYVNGSSPDGAEGTTRANTVLKMVSQVCNVSESALGLIEDTEDAVLCWFGSNADGELLPNRKYGITLRSDYDNANASSIYLYLPYNIDSPNFSSENLPAEEQQIVVYLDTDYDVDVELPYNCAYVGGNVPDTSAGLHKIICTWLPDKFTWLVGGIDYEVVS